MLLQDRVALAKEPLRVRRPDGRIYELPSSAMISDQLQRATRRYVLSDDIAALASRAAFGDPQRLARCFDLLVVPAPLLWIEWNENGRRQAMAELGIVHPESAHRPGGRVGLLVQSESEGRRGKIFSVWAAQNGDPELSPFAIHFNLDDATFSSTRSATTNLARSINFHDSNELSWMMQHARFDLQEAWRAYYQVACRSQAEFDAALDLNLGYISAHFPFLAAFSLLLVARDAVTIRPSDLQRLNASRGKKGRAPLLDHISVAAQPIAYEDNLGLSPAARAQARLHFVCGHFVRRKQTIYWRRGHLRGRVQQRA